MVSFLSVVQTSVLFCFCRRDKDLSPCPLTWDFYLVLVYLRVPVFEPLASKGLRTVTCRVCFYFRWPQRSELVSFRCCRVLLLLMVRTYRCLTY